MQREVMDSEPSISDRHCREHDVIGSGRRIASRAAQSRRWCTSNVLAWRGRASTRHMTLTSDRVGTSSNRGQDE